MADSDDKLHASAYGQQESRTPVPIARTPPTASTPASRPGQRSVADMFKRMPAKPTPMDLSSSLQSPSMAGSGAYGDAATSMAGSGAYGGAATNEHWTRPLNHWLNTLVLPLCGEERSTIPLLQFEEHESQSVISM